MPVNLNLCLSWVLIMCEMKPALVVFLVLATTNSVAPEWSTSSSQGMDHLEQFLHQRQVATKRTKRGCERSDLPSYVVLSFVGWSSVGVEMTKKKFQDASLGQPFGPPLLNFQIIFVNIVSLEFYSLMSILDGLFFPSINNSLTNLHCHAVVGQMPCCPPARLLASALQALVLSSDALPLLRRVINLEDAVLSIAAFRYSFRELQQVLFPLLSKALQMITDDNGQAQNQCS